MINKTNRVLTILAIFTFIFSLSACGGGDSGASPNAATSQGPQGPQGPRGPEGPAGTSGLQVKSVISCAASGDLDASNNNIYGEMNIYRLTDDSYLAQCESCLQINGGTDGGRTGCRLFDNPASVLSSSNFIWMRPLSGSELGFDCDTPYVRVLYEVATKKVTYRSHSRTPTEDKIMNCTETER